MACERIVDILEESGYRQSQPPPKPFGTYAQGWALATLKAMATKLNMHRPGPNRLAYHDHRFPQISVTEIEQKIARFGKLLNRFGTIRVEQHSKHLFWIRRLNTQ